MDDFIGEKYAVIIHNMDSPLSHFTLSQGVKKLLQSGSVLQSRIGVGIQAKIQVPFLVNFGFFGE